MQMISEHAGMLELFDPPQNLLFKIAPFWKFQKQCTEVGYKNGMKWVTRMYCFGLQKWNKTGYKNGMDWVTRIPKTVIRKIG